MEAQSHSDVDRQQLEIETLQHYKEHHTARGNEVSLIAISPNPKFPTDYRK